MAGADIPILHDTITGKTYASNQYDYSNHVVEGPNLKVHRCNKDFTVLDVLAPAESSKVQFTGTLKQLHDTPGVDSSNSSELRISCMKAR